MLFFVKISGTSEVSVIKSAIYREHELKVIMKKCRKGVVKRKSLKHVAKVLKIRITVWRQNMFFQKNSCSRLLRIIRQIDPYLNKNTTGGVGRRKKVARRGKGGHGGRGGHIQVHPSLFTIRTYEMIMLLFTPIFYYFWFDLVRFDLFWFLLVLFS